MRCASIALATSLDSSDDHSDVVMMRSAGYAEKGAAAQWAGRSGEVRRGAVRRGEAR
jgi:hypothetical protein